MPPDKTTVDKFLKFNLPLTADSTSVALPSGQRTVNSELVKFVSIYRVNREPLLESFPNEISVPVYWRDATFQEESDLYGGYDRRIIPKSIWLFSVLNSDFDQVIPTMVHELAHALDDLVLGKRTPGFASQQEDTSGNALEVRWQVWRESVKATPVYTRYKELEQMELTESGTAELKYLLDWRELFACAYTQTIFSRMDTRNVMRVAMAKASTEYYPVRTKQRIVRVPRQWNPDEATTNDLVSATLALFQ